MKVLNPAEPTGTAKPNIVLKNDDAKNNGVQVKLTSAEQGKLWSAYMGNTMSVCVLRYMLQHVEDQDIKGALETGIGLAAEFVKTIEEIFKGEDYPLPMGFTKQDVNEGAPRLFEDEFYLHYLKYVSKAGISLYGVAVPLMTRQDVRSFFIHCVDTTMQLMDQVNQVLAAKGIMVKPPFTPYPDKVNFIEKQSYLKGFFGNIRPLQALEITHLYDNVENNATSKSILIAFSQTAKSDQAKAYFLRGKEIAAKHYEIFSDLLQKEDLTAPPLHDPLVMTSTFPPFSDKLMMFHKLDMFSMRIRTYGNALSMSARHDLSEKYARLLLEVGNYVEDGAKIMIEHDWMEKPPHAADREVLGNR